ncbi:MAG TPA: hypothetical protein VJA94_13735 [Candidatus Angelobacter sp.]
MPPLLDLIKQNAVPAGVMRSAAKGALSLPASEIFQILVYLTENKNFGQEAAMTLARWDAPSVSAVLASTDAPQEVLEYFWNQKNRRPTLMPALLENPRIPEERLVELAADGSRQIVNAMLSSERVKVSPAVVEALLANPNLTEPEIHQLRADLAGTASELPDPESEAAHHSWSEEHAAEIAAEEGKPFEMTVAPQGEEEPAMAAVPVVKDKDHSGDAGAQRAPVKQAEREKLTVLQKVSRMNVAQRVRAAFIGSKEERAILIRDGAKIVQNAVLASPKLSEPEVEMFAAAKHVSENVLREIARNRRFMKNYSVVRNLVGNPRCPIDISLTLVKNLLVYDLKSLRHSKSISETVRRVADKLYKEKMDARAQQGSS